MKNQEKTKLMRTLKFQNQREEQVQILYLNLAPEWQQIGDIIAEIPLVKGRLTAGNKCFPELYIYKKALRFKSFGTSGENYYL